MLEKNQPAPHFETLNQNNKTISLSQFKGKQSVVLYFYPKDDTPGCTIQANEFTALADQFKKAGAVVLGVSKDSCESHQRFISKFNLAIDLLVDASGDLCEKYGCWGEKQWMGKKSMGIIRSTFMIDREGLLAGVFYKVTPKGHAQQMLDLAKSLA